MAEEVSIWGWPLQTAGLLTAEYSSRSLSIISGRVTEVNQFNIDQFATCVSYAFSMSCFWLILVLDSV